MRSWQFISYKYRNYFKAKFNFFAELDPPQPVPAPALPEGAERRRGQVLLVDSQPGEEAGGKTEEESHQVRRGEL